MGVSDYLLIVVSLLVPVTVTLFTMQVRRARRDGEIDATLNGISDQLRKRREAAEAIRAEVHELTVKVAELTAALRQGGHLNGKK